MAVIVTDRLTRRFGERTAVDELTLELPDRGVIGLVGPNGSGKSTLLRMLLGLVAPTSGDASVLGHGIGAPGAYLSRVGALVENPAFIPSLSARQNLLSLTKLRGLPDGRVAEVLDVVGLTGREREPVKRFSLGMKQRLGIAAALLPDPALLLLDEPTNGLDPSGIVEIRALLHGLSQQGRAVVVSSHLLAEIQAVCDWVVVLRFGRLVFNGPMDELLSQARHHVEVEPEHPADLVDLGAVLQAAGWAARPEGGRLRVAAEPGAAAEINRVAARAGITLAEVVRHQDSLEDVFLAMTGETDRAVAAERATVGGAA